MSGRRVLLEGATIVASILLAFGIDAWWDDHKDERREAILVDGLLADFRASRAGLEDRLALARRMSAGNELLVQRLGGHAAGSSVAVPEELVLAVLGGPTYEANTSALDAAVASGEIELLENRELRSALANWKRLLADTTEDELEVRRITNQQLVPLLSRSIDLTGYYGRLLDWSAGSSDAPPDAPIGAAERHVSLVTSNELGGALAVRNFYMRFAATDLETLLASLDEIVALLERELEGA